MKTDLTRRDVVIIQEIISDLKSRCNRHANGECMSLICLYNGGYERATKPDYEMATCKVHEQVKVLESFIN